MVRIVKRSQSGNRREWLKELGKLINILNSRNTTTGRKGKERIREIRVYTVFALIRRL